MKEHRGHQRPVGGLSLDLDNLWSYLKTQGYDGWEDDPSYFDRAVPTILDQLDELGLKITFFVVGKDASLDKNREALREIAARGHEIGNHSFSHEPWFHRYDGERTSREVVDAEEAIEAATGIRPRGWRGPGFSFSSTVLEVLEARGYQYDASTFPTFLGPIARIFFLATSRLDSEEKKLRSQLYGSVKDGFRSLKPFHWELGGERQILEVPVTTLPFVRTPVHASYLHYLATFSEPAAGAYWRMALTACRAAGIRPNFLLHPTDFLGGDDVPEMRFFPAMDVPGEVKRLRTGLFLRRFIESHEVLPMGAYARRVTEKLSELSGLSTASSSAAPFC